MEERREGGKVGNKKGNKKNGRSQGTVQVVNKGGKGRTSRLLLGKNCKKSKLLKNLEAKKATFAGSLFKLTQTTLPNSLACYGCVPSWLAQECS